MDERQTLSFTPIRTTEDGIIIYNLRVVPFLSLTKDEIKDMSIDPRYMVRRKDGWHVEEMPIRFHGNTMELNQALMYIYDEMNDEEKKTYKDRFEVKEISSSEVENIFARREKEKDDLSGSHKIRIRIFGGRKGKHSS